MAGAGLVGPSGQDRGWATIREQAVRCLGAQRGMGGPESLSPLSWPLDEYSGAWGLVVG